MTSEMKADPERIWLQPRCCASEHEGRLWCEDKVFDDCEDGNEPTEYVRADLARPPADQVPDMVEVVERVFSENIGAQALRLLVHPAMNDGESPGAWMCRVRKTALVAALKASGEK